jgi:hypothetical protein
MTTRPPVADGHTAAAASVALYWIPLGAGGQSVRLNGIVYEVITAAIERRSRCDLYHSALEVVLPSGHYTVEMTPVPDRFGAHRGVVAEGPVGARALVRFRLFRYEVRRWRDGIVPDLASAAHSPVVLTADQELVRAVFKLLPSVPQLTWGRDESHTGEMWSCNSITSWVLARAGLDVDAIALPPRGRAPGWDAGIALARRDLDRNRRELMAIGIRRASRALAESVARSRCWPASGWWAPAAAGIEAQIDCLALRWVQARHARPGAWLRLLPRVRPGSRAHPRRASAGDRLTTSRAALRPSLVLDNIRCCFWEFVVGSNRWITRMRSVTCSRRSGPASSG